MCDFTPCLISVLSNYTPYLISVLSVCLHNIPHQCTLCDCTTYLISVLCVISQPTSSVYSVWFHSLPNQCTLCDFTAYLISVLPSEWFHSLPRWCTLCDFTAYLISVLLSERFHSLPHQCTTLWVISQPTSSVYYPLSDFTACLIGVLCVISQPTSSVYFRCDFTACFRRATLAASGREVFSMPCVNSCVSMEQDRMVSVRPSWKRLSDAVSYVAHGLPCSLNATTRSPLHFEHDNETARTEHDNVPA